jgi:hypothetical protein
MTTISRLQLDAILEAAELYETGTDDDLRSGVDDLVYVSEAYSGRGMYDATCLGFTLSSHANAYRLTAAMGAILGAAKARQIASKAATDIMGLDDMILYFPGVTLDA